MNGINNMKNLNVSVKSRGVLLFAFNSSVVNYVEIANRASIIINKILKLPVCIVTDFQDTLPDVYDQIITVNTKTGNVRYDRSGNTYEWRNFDRYKVYEFSPYDETLLIDSDYIQFDNSLLKLFDQQFDYRLQYKMQTPLELNRDEMGPISLPMVWATSVLFRKTEKSKIFFDLVGRIQRNFGYYRTLFGIPTGNYRNDFAFSIANIMINGYAISPEQSIPWPMTTIEDTIESIICKNKFLIVKYKNKADVISRQNLHIMDKQYLLSNDFQNLVNEIVNE